MPSAEYFGEDEQDPEYLDSVTRAQTALFGELCAREPRLAVTLKQAGVYDPNALYTHPVYAHDDFPQRINTYNLPDFPRNIGAAMLLPRNDREEESSLGKVISSTHHQIEIDTQLLRSSIAAMPEEMQYAIQTSVTRRFKVEALQELSKFEQIADRIRCDLLAHMCHLERELYDIVVRDNQYPIAYLIDMAGMPVMGPKNVFTGQQPVICNVATTISDKPECRTTAEESFGDVHEITDRLIFLNDELTECGLAALSDAQRTLLHKIVLEEMVARHASKFKKLGTNEEMDGIRQMFTRGLYELLVMRPRRRKDVFRQMLSSDQNFRRN